jgi:hypothetical protein
VTPPPPTPRRETDKASAAPIDPTETRFESAKSIPQRANARSVGNGTIPRKTPRLVATPRPPRKRSQGVNTCPRMDATPPTRARVRRIEPGEPSGCPSPTSTRARRAATSPFSMSITKTTAPHRAPRTRNAFVAPMFLLPCARRSTPRAPADQEAGGDGAKQKSDQSGGDDEERNDAPSRTAMRASDSPSTREGWECPRTRTSGASRAPGNLHNSADDSEDCSRTRRMLGGGSRSGPRS